MLTGGRLLVECLTRNGVDFMTCVPGESFLAILDGIYDAQRASSAALPRLVTTRHEAAAANMAEAAGKLTGRLAACFVTRGPGAMHASIAVHTAYQDGTPMLLVIGQVARHTRGREAFQEMDYAAVFGTTTKSVVEIQDADRIPEHVARALYLATAGRPGPVVLVVPEDVLSELSAVEPLLAPVEQSSTASAEDASAWPLCSPRPSARSSSSAVRGGTPPLAGMWLPLPRRMGFRSPPPSAGRTRSTTGAAATSATSGPAVRRCCAPAPSRRTSSSPSGRASTTRRRTASS